MLRLQAQRLIPETSENHLSVDQVLEEVCSVQGQELPAAQIALHMRAPGLHLAEIERARQETGTILRTWAMRGTLHLLSKEDVRWLIPFLAPTFISGNHRRMEQLGWDDMRTTRGLRLLESTLETQTNLTRVEIIAILKSANLPSEGQAPIHLIYRAAWEGILIQGPDRGKKPTFVPAEYWTGPFVHQPIEQALLELTRRYLHAYAPATLQDMSAWSGLALAGIRQAWQALGDELAQVMVDEQPAWMLKSDLVRLDNIERKFPQVNLIPKFDNLLLGYADRAWIVDPQFAKQVNSGGGIIHPTLVVNGQVQGVWRINPAKKTLELILAPFTNLSPEQIAYAEEEVAQLGAFMGKSLSMKVMPVPSKNQFN